MRSGDIERDVSVDWSTFGDEHMLVFLIEIGTIQLGKKVDHAFLK